MCKKWWSRRSCLISLCLFFIWLLNPNTKVKWFTATCLLENSVAHQLLIKQFVFFDFWYWELTQSGNYIFQRLQHIPVKSGQVLCRVYKSSQKLVSNFASTCKIFKDSVTSFVKSTCLFSTKYFVINSGEILYTLIIILNSETSVFQCELCFCCF